MRGAYRVLAHLMMISVVLQAMVIVWGMFGLGRWIQDGGVVNKAVMDERETLHFTAERGFMFHGIGATFVVPAVALALLIVSFFAKVASGVRGALIVVALVVVQVVLGMVAHNVPWLGLVHGLNAFLIIGVAKAADNRVKTVSVPAKAAAR